MKNLEKIKKNKRERKKKRERTKIKKRSGNKPRLSVFRSNRHIYCQLIDDEKGITIVSASDLEFKNKLKKEEKQKLKINKIDSAYEIGKLIAERALKAKITKVVFDRGRYKYHGKIKALAQGAREGGLSF